MEIDPKKIDFGETEPYEKLEGGNMKSDLKAIKDGYDREENIESANENKTASVPIPSPENLNQTGKPSLTSPLKLLSDAWRLYKSRWKTFLGIIIVPILLIFFIFAILIIGTLVMGLLGSFVSEFTTGKIIIFAIGFILFLILFLVIIIIQFWSQAALIYAIKDSAENIGIKESYRRGWHKIRSFFWVSVLSGFIIMGGYMFFIIPGIIFAIWFSLALYIVIAEDLKGMNALLKSREYIRNYWWPVLWRFLCIGLLIYLIIAIFVFFIFLIATLCGIIWSLSSDSFEVMINLPINILSLIFTPLMVIYSFLIYSNLKKIKGDFEFKPSKKSKRLFIVTGLLGFLIIPLLLFSSIVLISLNSARDKAMDVARRSDMAQLQIKLLIYSDEERVYPKSLSELNDIGYFIDPETKEPYEYRQLDNGKDYEVCALFEEGRQCFYSEDSAYETPDKYEYNDDVSDTEKETPNNSITERDEQRISDLRYLSATLRSYYHKYGHYPISPSFSNLNEDNDAVQEIKSNTGGYIQTDPGDYYYGYKSSDGKSFELTAQLENINDSRCDAEIKEDSGVCIYKLQY